MFRERLIGFIDAAVSKFDRVISGDEEKPLTPAQEAQMKQWFETRQRLIDKGFDLNWGDPTA